MTDDADVIQHLIQIEREASLMQKQAQEEADAKIAQARNLADQKFREQFSQIATRIEQSESEQKELLAEKREKDLEEYKKSLSSIEKDTSAFNRLLDSIL